MSQRTFARVRSLAALFVLSCLGSIALGQPVINGVASRMSHAGTVFDLPLPQTSPYGVECRNVTTGMTLVISFDRTVNSGTAAVFAGTATMGTTTFANNEMAVTLTGVGNPTIITLRLTNVQDTTNAPGGILATADVSFRVLMGDCNETGNVNTGDINYVKFFNGKPLDYGNFRADLNLSGNINTGDIAFVQSQNGKAAGVGSAPNTAPVISNIPDQITPAGTPTAPVAFTVSDAESPATNLQVTAASSDQTIVPTANITIGGTGTNRTITITPAAAQTGVSTITVTVSDGLATAVDTFVVTAGTPQKLYLANLAPQTSSIVTSAAGSATLTVNGAETQAVLRISYSGLTSAKTNMHIHGPADPGQDAGILFDIDAATPQADGSFIYTFVPIGGGAISVADIVTAIRSGRTYLNVHTVNYPNGEIRGHFNLAAGSINFTAPAAPPPIAAADMELTAEPQATRNAVRFLTQASFGATNGNGTANTDVAYLKTKGYSAWIDEQIALPATSMLTIHSARIKDGVNVYGLDGNNVNEIWWNLALQSNDQLRQRVALAYSELFVVSRSDGNIDGDPLALSSYHDMLANDAFVNFRKIIEDVTLHPIMGQFLSMKGNVKQATANSPKPNENYAREILQLFAVGLNNLQPDGTLKLDNAGLPIPTYDQNTIENFARIFTGWNTNSTTDYFDYWDTATSTVKTGTSGIGTRNIRPMVPTAGNHDFLSKTLLLGSPIPIGGIVIARSSSTANANLDLKEALDNIYNHPNIGPFIARRMIQRLVTSNPSPGYIYRVASIFNDDNSGTATARGNMGAVIKAVLTDYEARTAALATTQGFGKVKEPLLRISQAIRAHHPYSNGPQVPAGSGGPKPAYWRLASSDTYLAQTPYNALTVFNFFNPDYNIIETLTNSGNANETYTVPVNAPEMQINTENTAVYVTRMLRTGIIEGPASVAVSGTAGKGFETGTGTTDVRIDLSYEAGLAFTGVSPDTHSAACDRLLDYLNNVLLAGQITQAHRDLIKNYLISKPVTDPTQRARIAIYLITASPQFNSQK